GSDVTLPQGFDPVDQALLSDPQTSGGLLVSCRPEAAADVLAVFKRHGFTSAAVIGETSAAAGKPGLIVR
ncbi:MAG TPA: AIR synthase-related protein, partial [Ramlibacter sp.]|nr:AIR synthase-related protein [Ramlibacter sp.]